jgi:hypothetical protein
MVCNCTPCGEHSTEDVSVQPDKDLIVSQTGRVTLAGKTFDIAPITVGQMRRLRAEFRKLPPPEPVAVDVQGLVQAMFHPGPDEEGAVRATMGPLAHAELGKIRQMVAATVQEMVREARARTEQWPPAVETPEGMNLIYSDERIQPLFVAIVLGKHLDEAQSLLDEAGAHEYPELVDAAFRSLMAYQDRKTAEQLNDPKLNRLIELQQAGASFISGGAPALSALPNGANR